MPRVTCLRPRLSTLDTRRAKPPPKQTLPFYKSPEWRHARGIALARARGTCQTPGCGRRERYMYVDHVIELKDGGAPLDQRNLQVLCGPCHNRKTAKERARRQREAELE